MLKYFFIIMLLIINNCGVSAIDELSTQNSSTLNLAFLQKDFSTNLFFNTHFLSHYNLVTKILIGHEQFQEVYFHTHDRIKLNGLLRFNNDAPYTIIFCAGFYPGRKEGLATFIKMVPEKVNILFFDARGHGKSEGRFLTNLHNYGISEYNDILGAIEFINLKTDKPIFIHGICAGAFHAAHALTQIDTKKYHIKGLIFDSGLVSILNACQVPEKHICEKIIPGFLVSLYNKDTKNEIKERYVCKLLCLIASAIFKVATTMAKPSLEQAEKELNLLNKIAAIPCPILFIHSYDDTYSPIENVKKLYEKTQYKECWWIEKSEHALHHLKHKDEYTKKLNRFLQ